MERVFNFCLAKALCLTTLLLPGLAAGSESWHRDTALSPDGKSILFTHMGDIFRVASSGGVAVPLTSSDAIEVNPVWSPDGKWVAFGSDLHGNLDVFVIPAAGGAPQRLTFHASDDVVADFSADSQRVLFTSSRYDALNASIDPQRRNPELYEVARSGGTPVQVTTLYARQARWNRNGDALLFADDKRETLHRKHDDSPFARDVWRLLPAENRFERLTTNVWNDHTPAWDESGDGFYFLSERSGSLNVWHQQFAGGEGSARQVSFHELHPVRDLSVSDGGDIAYSLHGQVYFGARGEQAKPVTVTVVTGKHVLATQRIDLGADISEFVVSPDGKEVAFVARGDVFATSVEFETTRQITRTAGEERNLAYTADGRALLYASQRLDQWSIYESVLEDEEESHFFLATRIAEQRLLQGDKSDRPGEPRVAVTHPVPSPDGERIAYVSDWREVRVLERRRKRSVTVVDGELNYSMGNDDIRVSWSPDSRWLAVSIQPNGRLFFPEIALVPADGSAEPAQLTRSGYTDAVPDWHASGGFISWITGRYGLREHGGHGTQYDVYAQFLNQAAWDAFRRTEEEVSLEESEDDEEEEEEEREPEPVVIDLDRAGERQARLTIHSSDLAGFALNADGSVLYYLSAFEEGYDLWSHDFRAEETSRIATIGADSATLALLEDDSAAIVLADGELMSIDLEAEDPSAEAIPLLATVDHNAAAERQAMLHHIWQTTRDRIYLPAVLTEARWDDMYAAYAAKLPAVNNNRDFAELADELVGELDVSHAAGRYRPEPGDATGAIGAILDLSDTAAGVVIAEVLTQGPLAEASDRASAGNRILAVNDQRLGEGVNYFALLNNSVDQPTRLTLADRRGEFDVVLRPVSQEEETEWLMEQWIESRHALVEKLSGGRLGYVYLPEMSDDTYRRVYGDVFGRNFTREAIVIDVRDNNGGDLVDWLVQLFSGTRYMTNVPNGRPAQGEPLTEWVKPSIALTNEGAYSDGHCFVAAWKNLGISTLVGTPVTGTCTYAGWEMLPSGDVLAGTPRLGILDPEGDYLERKTTDPDVLIYAHPNDIVAGEDAQLKRAVEVLLGELDSGQR